MAQKYLDGKTGKIYDAVEHKQLLSELTAQPARVCALSQEALEIVTTSAQGKAPEDSRPRTARTYAASIEAEEAERRAEFEAMQEEWDAEDEADVIEVDEDEESADDEEPVEA